MKWLKLKNLILQGWSMSSRRLSQRSKSRGRIMRWLSMREISLARNSSKGMKNWLCFTKRSRFKNPLWRRERFTTKKKFMTFWISGRKSPSWRESLLLRSARLLVFQIWREKSTCCRKSILSSNKKPSISSMSLLNHSTFIDGGNLSVLIQRPTKWSKKYSPCRRGLLPRLRKYLKRMFLSRKKRSSTSSLRIFWPSSLVQK